MIMKKKIIFLFFLFALCVVFVFFLNKQKPQNSHKILKVIEADEFYIDINDNNKIDNDEHFKIKNIEAFKPIKNKETLKYAKILKLNTLDYLKLGCLARSFAHENLLNQEITIVSLPEKYDETKIYREIDINFNNENYALFLLKSGLAISKPNFSNSESLKIQNLNQAKINLENLKNIDFLIVNLKNDIVHSLNCEFSDKITNAELILAKDYNNFRPCKICYDENKKIFKNNEILKNSAHSNLKFKFNFSIDPEILKSIPKNKQNYKTSLYKKFNTIEFFSENPYLIKKPQDSCRTKICTRLVQEINSAEKSIDAALYGFGKQKEIFEALKNAKTRGVKIRSVVDYSKNMDKIYPNTRNFITEFGSITDKNEILMHNKFIIFDNSKVFTGSYNISETGSGGYNLNSGILIKNTTLANQYTKEFEQMYNGLFSNKKLKIVNPEIKTADFSFQVYFLPKQNGYTDGIFPLILNAEKEIFISAFYLTDRNLINELIKAKNRGVNVLIMVDALGAKNFKERIELLRKAKIPLKIENWGGKNHEKTILIDSKILILGSNNFSKSGFYKNDENFLIIKNSSLGGFYRDFYLYLFNSIDNKFLKLYPSAEGHESINSCNDGIDNDYDGKIDKEDEACK